MRADKSASLSEISIDKKSPETFLLCYARNWIRKQYRVKIVRCVGRHFSTILLALAILTTSNNYNRDVISTCAKIRPPGLWADRRRLFPTITLVPQPCIDERDLHSGWCWGIGLLWRSRVEYQRREGKREQSGGESAVRGSKVGLMFSATVFGVGHDSGSSLAVSILFCLEVRKG